MSPTHRYHDFLHTASRLPSHVLRTILVLAALAGTGLTLGAIALEMNATHPVRLESLAVPATQPTTAAAAQAPVMLATVTVRADSATEVADADASVLPPLRAVSASAAGTLVRRAAGTALVMPYYSFAKPLSASIEE
ncbi:MAG: hypothetical protein DWB45_09750 [Xanthomonadales bacterium]|nr:MAG: hypothetical protein F9K31_02700 [Dokdonella sp.]MBC6942994.1 hypothetical protein [Xanthomonadales bacterium]MDL1869472.1 hypothetical protein [Gammaproteobacteria bacterium PRO6]